MYYYFSEISSVLTHCTEWLAECSKLRRHFKPLHCLTHLKHTKEHAEDEHQQHDYNDTSFFKESNCLVLSSALMHPICFFSQRPEATNILFALNALNALMGLIQIPLAIYCAVICCRAVPGCCDCCGVSTCYNCVFSVLTLLPLICQRLNTGGLVDIIMKALQGSK